MQTTGSTPLAYPVALQERQDSVLVSFPDVPEALTEGATRQEALEVAADCLVAALGGYVRSGLGVPAPSPGNGGFVVELSRMVTAKLALHQAMRDRDIDATGLAQRLGVADTAVERLLDLDDHSHVDQIAQALAALGLPSGTGVHMLA